MSTIRLARNQYSGLELRPSRDHELITVQTNWEAAKGPETDEPVELINEGARKIRHKLRTSHTEATEPMRHVAIDGTAREKLVWSDSCQPRMMQAVDTRRQVRSSH